MSKSDGFISTRYPGPQERETKIRWVHELRALNWTFTEIAVHLGVDPSQASRLGKINLQELQFDPPDEAEWKYKPLWISREGKSEEFKMYWIREDGLIWDPERGEARRTYPDGDGYRTISLSGRALKVHRLVAWAFLGPPADDKDYIRHLDGIEDNNFYSNLAWGSPQDNAQDKIIQGGQMLNAGKQNSGYSDGSQSILRDNRFHYITRKMVFDAGHRVPFHHSKCSNMHGHTWTLEATFGGLMKPVRHQSDDGMVMDFGNAKRLMSEAVVDIWDHGFIVWRGDKKTLRALSVFDDHKTVIVDMPPTSEYLVRKAFIDINQLLVAEYGFSCDVFLYKTVLYETPNCYSTWVSNVFGERQD